MTARVAYLDSSAFVKLVGRDPESGAFVRLGAAAREAGLPVLAPGS